MKKFLTIAALSLLCGGSIMAQSKYNISGSIIDKETNDAIISGTVQLINLPDSSFSAGVVTDTQGAFNFKNIAKGKYAIKVSYIGYQTKYVDLDLNTKKGKKVDMGYITMLTDAIMLKEAEVSAHASKVRASGDSLIFNASAYRTPEGSVLEDLVKQLPGAKVDADGNVTINGKTVTKILIDGKEFFLDDKNVAMKNIPTDMIENLKSYDRKSDLARVTGIDDGEEETVLDLTVKKGMNNGWFGNVNLGAGTKHRYNERAMVNRFTDNTNFTVLGGANNVADRGYGGGGGRWGGWGGGLRSSKEVGTNFATENDKLETGGSVRYNYNGSDNENMSSSENFAAMTGRFNENIGKNLSSNKNFNTQFRLEWKPDTMTNIIFRPNFSISSNNGSNNSHSASYDGNPNDITGSPLDYNTGISAALADGAPTPTDDILNRLIGIVVNTNDNTSQSHSNNLNMRGMLQLNRKFNNDGRNITLRLNGNYSEGKNKQLSAADIAYKASGMSGTQNNRYFNTPSSNYNISARLSYSEPIAKKTYLQFSYQINYSYSKNDREAYIYESAAYQDLQNSLRANRYDIDAVLDFMKKTGYQTSLSDSLSQFSEYRNTNHDIEVSFRKVTDYINLNVGIDLMPQHNELNYKYMGKEYPEVSRNVFNIAPRVNFRYNFNKQTQLQLRYNARTSQPSMTNLLDIRDDSNPLYISEGNPDLKPSLSHNINANFNTYNADAQRSIWAYASFNTTHNSIANKTTYDERGVQTSKPMNINGNWNTYVGTGFNTGLGAEKAFNIGFDAGTSFSHNVGFYNNRTQGNSGNEDIKSITKNLGIDGGIDASYRNDFVSISLNGHIDYSHTSGNVRIASSTDTYDFNYGGEFEWTTPWGTEIATDIGMRCRRGYDAKEANTNELLWNAQISHSFLQGKALTLSLSVSDILGQQSNLSRNISALMRSDSRSNAIYQYAMLRATYRFSIFGGKNAMGTDNERSGGWGGRRW